MVPVLLVMFILYTNAADMRLSRYINLARTLSSLRYRRISQAPRKLPVDRGPPDRLRLGP